MKTTKMENIGVIGCGVMGTGIAQVMLQGGHSVLVCETDESFLEKGIARLKVNFKKLVEKEKISTEDETRYLAELSGTTRLKDLKSCDLVIEAVYEDIEIKKNIFKALDDVCDDATIFASNTSSMSITEMAASTSRQGRFIGMHFFNPAQIMPLVEIVKTICTERNIIDRMLDLVKGIGKTPVVARDEAGFIVNSLLTPYLLDAMRAFSHGVASIGDIDTAIKCGMNHPMGPLMLSDLIGLDILYNGSMNMFEEYRDPRYAPPPILKKMIMMNYLGKKTKKGFYDWSDIRNPIPANLSL